MVEKEKTHGKNHAPANKEQEYRELEPLEQWEQEEKKPTLFIKILAVIGIIILLVWFFTAEPIRTILVGFIDSSVLKNTAEGKTIAIKDISFAQQLSFVNHSYDSLLEISARNTGKEFQACLLGTADKGTYTIYSLLIPETYSQTETEVVAEPCPDESLVSLHSHPESHCLPSGQDVSNYEDLQRRNNRSIMAVMCGKDRFNFYTS